MPFPILSARPGRWLQVLSRRARPRACRLCTWRTAHSRGPPPPCTAASDEWRSRPKPGRSPKHLARTVDEAVLARAQPQVEHQAQREDGGHHLRRNVREQARQPNHACDFDLNDTLRIGRRWASEIMSRSRRLATKLRPGPPCGPTMCKPVSIGDGAWPGLRFCRASALARARSSAPALSSRAMCPPMPRRRATRPVCWDGWMEERSTYDARRPSQSR